MIGILDSGIGGENVAKEVRKLFPSLDILLLKDIKNAHNCFGKYFNTDGLFIMQYL